MISASQAVSKAAQLWNGGAKGEAMAVLMQALAVLPGNAELNLAVGNASLRMLRHQAADAYFQKALEGSADRLGTAWSVAELLMHIGLQPHKALACLAAAGADRMDPMSPDPQKAALQLELWDRTGREREAMEWTHLQFSDPSRREKLLDSPAFVSRYGPLLGRSGEVPGAIALLEHAAGLPAEAFDPRGPVRCLYQAARLRKGLNEAETAWATLRKAHRQYAKMLPPVFKARARMDQLDWVRNAVRQRTFGPSPEAGRAGEPRVLVMAGFPRSGTTLMQRLITEQVPGLSVLDERECMEILLRSAGLSPVMPAGMEDDRLGQLAAGYFSMARELLPQPPGRLILDKMPGATHVIPSYAMIFRDVRILWPVRDPRDVLTSGLFLHLPPNDSTPAFLDPLALASYIKNTYECWWDIRDRLRVPWMECRYEDVVKNPGAHAGLLADFATDGLAETSPDPDQQAARPAEDRQALSPSYAEARRPIHDHSIGSWKQYAKPLAPALRLLGPLIRKLGYA